MSEATSETTTLAIPERSENSGNIAGFFQMLGDFFAKHQTLVATVGTSLLVFGFQTLQGIFLARILGPTARGEFATIIFYTQTLTYIGLFGTIPAIARLAAQNLDRKNEIARTTYRLGWITGLATVGLVALLALVALPSEKRYLAPFCIGCALLLPFEHIRLLLLSVDHGSAKFTSYNWNRVLASVLFPFLLSVFWWTGSRSLVWICILAVTAPLLGALGSILPNSERRCLNPAWPSSWSVLNQGKPYAFAQVAADLFSRLHLFLVLWLADFTQQGYYATAVPAAALVFVAPTALALFSFNAGANPDNYLSYRKLGISIVGVLVFQAICAGIYALILGPLITFVYGDRFLGTIPFALALLPNFAMLGAVEVAEGYLRGRGKPVVGVWSRFVSTAVMLICVYFMYPHWKIMSIPVAAVIGQGVIGLIIVGAIVADIRSRK